MPVFEPDVCPDFEPVFVPLISLTVVDPESPVGVGEAGGPDLGGVWFGGADAGMEISIAYV